MAGGTWRVTMLGLAVGGLAMAYLGAEAGRAVGGDPIVFVADMAALGVGLFALWLVFARLGRHFRDMDRLREALASPRGRGEGLAGWDAPRRDELGLLAQAVAELGRRERRSGGRPVDRLSMVADLLEEPVLVLGGQGRIDVRNGAAAALLDAAPGDDIYDHLHRPDLFRAIERAREGGQAVSAVLRRIDGAELPARVADLGLQAGVVLVFPPRRPETRALLSGTRSVVTPNGRAPHLGDEEPLGTLPLVALWIATTAVDPASPADGAVVAVGTMRLAGPRVFRTLSLDFLIDPGEAVPPEAAARHGVTTAMIEGARPFADAGPAIADALRGCVVVGFDVGAALDALGRARARAGLADEEAPPSLDLRRLAWALEPTTKGMSAEEIARVFGVTDRGSADVFAPVRRTADLASVLITRLCGCGVATHGEARAFGTAATAISAGDRP